SFHWVTASVKPFTPKLTSSRLKVVTIVTSPKSTGARSRAKTTVEKIWIARPRPEENTVTPAPRIARLRNPFKSAKGRKLPRSSNGFKRPPLTMRDDNHLAIRTQPNLRSDRLPPREAPLKPGLSRQPRWKRERRSM